MIRDALLPLAGRLVPRAVQGDPNHWLIVQPDHLGDILLSQPAVNLIRESQPDARLTAVVGPWSERAAGLFWPVNEVVTVEFPGFQRTCAQHSIDPYLQLVRDTSKLKTLSAGHAVVLRPDAWWAAWLAAGVAPDVVTGDDHRVTQFATTSVALRRDAHAVVRSWTIAAAATGNSHTSTDPFLSPLLVVPQPEALTEVSHLLEANGITGQFAVIHPGSGAAVKEWPPNRWRAVASGLAREGLAVVVSGSLAEFHVAEYVSTAVNGAISVAGSTCLEQLIALMSRASLVLGPDSGPLHIAVATGTPSIHLFGPSDPFRYGPWGEPTRHRVVSNTMKCSRCGDLSSTRSGGCGCMLAIEVGDVMAEVRVLLAYGP